MPFRGGESVQSPHRQAGLDPAAFSLPPLALLRQLLFAVRLVVAATVRLPLLSMLFVVPDSRGPLLRRVEAVLLPAPGVEFVLVRLAPCVVAAFLIGPVTFRVGRLPAG